MMSTKIAWTDESWNPVTGCTPVSEGCAHCYAKRMTERFGGDFSKVTLHPDRLEIPLRWRKPRRVLVCSMGDLFHEDVPTEFIWRVLQTMAAAQNHTFQVLTKRPKRMRQIALQAWPSARNPHPLPNLWLGVSVENQARADERIPLLLETPAAVRFVSAEPLLGPLKLKPWLPKTRTVFGRKVTYEGGLDWVIVGGESGPGARLLVERCWHDDGPGAFYGPEHHGLQHIGSEPTTGSYHYCPMPEALEWVRSLRDQCQAAGVPFFFKQWGPKAGQGTLVDGREHKEMPR